MNSDDITAEFENAIEKALNQFEQRLRQQQLFQVQNDLLKELQKEVVSIGFCNSEDIKNLSEQYQVFYIQLKESGRSYENIVAEKNLVDTYSAFEKLLFDCYFSIYQFFPKFLGSEVKVSTLDLFIDSNMDICKQNIIESQVKDFIQKNNIIDILNGFKKLFDIKKLIISQNELNLFYEIGLVRNLVIHNNGIVNRVYKEGARKFLQNKEKYPFNEGETVLNKLEDIVQNIKDLSTKTSKYITETIINDSKRLNLTHENKS